MWVVNEKRLSDDEMIDLAIRFGYGSRNRDGAAQYLRSNGYIVGRPVAPETVVRNVYPGEFAQ